MLTRVPSVPAEEQLEEDFVALRPETRCCLERFEALILKWGASKNLVSKSDLRKIRTRHIRDCLRIFRAAPGRTRWLDVGSGVGFPGVVIAACLMGTSGGLVHCVECDHRKCSFLATVARELRIPLVIHPHRFSVEESNNYTDVEAVTARAVAGLSDLIGMFRPYIDSGAVGIFPVGQGFRVSSISLSSDYYWDIIDDPEDALSRLVRIRRTS